MSMTTARAAGPAAAVALLLLGVLSASAGDLAVPVGDRVVLSNPADAGECRLLLALEPPEELESAVILLAMLRIDVPEGALIGELPPIEVFVCEREWSGASAGWDEGWESGEGVWDESSGALVDVVRVGTGLVLTADVTGVLRAAVQASGDEPALIMVPWFPAAGLAPLLGECPASISVDWMPAERVSHSRR